VGAAASPMSVPSGELRRVIEELVLEWWREMRGANRFKVNAVPERVLDDVSLSARDRP
jgi:hypothetical protein